MTNPILKDAKTAETASATPDIGTAALVPEIAALNANLRKAFLEIEGLRAVADERVEEVEELYSENDLLRAACRFALSVMKANHPVEASEFLAIEELEKAIACAEQNDQREDTAEKEPTQ